MTAEFVEGILEEITGEDSTNKWITLAGKCQRIGLLGDDTIYVDPIHKIFYFDSDAESLYIRKLSGILIQSDAQPGPGYSSIEINGVNYLNKIEDNFVDYGDAGEVHTIVGYDKIVGFYSSNFTMDVINSYLDDIKNNI